MKLKMENLVELMGSVQSHSKDYYNFTLQYEGDTEAENMASYA